MTSSLGTVLVTGGAGFIGCELSQALATSADRWVVLDNMHPQVHASPTSRPGRLAAEAELIVGDVTDSAAWDDVLERVRPDVVFHLAAETGTAQSLSESNRHASVNVVGTTQMIDAFTRVGHDPAHIVLTSSRAVYGEGLWRRADGATFYPPPRTRAQLDAGHWQVEDAEHVPNAVAVSLPAPVSVYGATKLAQEHVLSAWVGARSTALSVLRLQNVYGPGQSLSNPYTGIVPLFSRIAAEGRSIPLYEDGDITRDFVYIDDVISALAAAVERAPADLRRTVDVGTGTRTTIRDLAETVAAMHSAPAPQVTGQFRDGDVRHARCDVAATTADLGWTPQWSLDDGVRALQAWIDEQARGADS